MRALTLGLAGVIAVTAAQERPPTGPSKTPPYERLLTGDDAKKAKGLSQSYDKAMAAEDWGEARKNAQALLELRIAKQGADHYEVTDARHALNDVEVRAKLTPDERKRLREADQQNEQLIQLHQQGQFAKAAQLGERILAAKEKLLGESHPEYATSLSNLAMLYDLMGESARAEPLTVRARDLRKKVLGESHPDYAASLNNLAGLYQSMGENARAELLMLQARDLLKTLWGENHPDYATSLYNLAGLYKSMGEYAKAEPLYLQARDLTGTLLGENHPYYADSLNSLGLLYYSRGEYAKAEPLYVQARDLFKTLLGENHPSYAASLNNLGLLYKAMGEHAKAEPLYLQARDLRKKVLGENHPDYALSLNNLALLYQAMGDYARAEPLLVQARDLRKKVRGENHPDYAASLNNLAELYRSTAEYAKAEPLLVQARDLTRTLLGESHPRYAATLNNLALLYCSVGESAKAEPLLVESARSYEMSRIARAGGFGRATGGEGQNPYPPLATVSARLNKSREGFAVLERSLARAFLDVLAERRGQTLTPDQQARRARIVNELSPIDRRIAALVNRPKLTAEETTELTEKIASRSKLNVELADLAVELSTQEVSDLAAIQKAIPGGAALLAWADVTTKDGKLQEHYACVVKSAGEPVWVPLPGTGERGKWTADDARLTLQFRDAVGRKTPAADVAALTKKLHAQRIAPVLKHLDGVTTLYVVGVNEMAAVPVEVLAPEYTVGYVPSGTYLARLPKKPAFANTLLAVGDPIYAVEGAEAVKLTALPPGGLLVQQVAPGGAADRAMLLPGDVLLKYADADLKTVDDLKAGVARAVEGKAKEVAVTVWRVDARDKAAERAVTLPAGPLGVVLATDPAPRAVADRRKSDALFAALTRGDVWADLPGTRYEVARVAALFERPTVLLDGKASEAEVDALRKGDKLKGYRYLHFATHGRGSNAAAFESKLVLSQDRPKGELKAGEPWLNNEVSAREVLDHWKLNADLVTLSACETAGGKQGGGDGLLGFAQAFLTAGSRSVCLSLWEVDDTATALLMQRFYQNLLGQRDGLKGPMGKAAALKEAKEWLKTLSPDEALAAGAKLTAGVVRGERKEISGKVVGKPPEATAPGDKPYAHPRYWAAFVLLGDPD